MLRLKAALHCQLGAHLQSSKPAKTKWSVADPDTAGVAGFPSALQSDSGYDAEYSLPIIRVAEICDG